MAAGWCWREVEGCTHSRAALCWGYRGWLGTDPGPTAAPALAREPDLLPLDRAADRDHDAAPGGSLPAPMLGEVRVDWPATRIRPHRHPGRRRLEVAALVSLLLHSAILGTAWWWWVRHKQAAMLVPVASPPVVQLVMSPPGGKPHPAPVPHTPSPPPAKAEAGREQPAAKPAPSPPDREPVKSAPTPDPRVKEKRGEPLADVAKLAAPSDARASRGLPPVQTPAPEPPTEAADAHQSPRSASPARPAEPEKTAPAVEKPAQQAAPASARPDDKLSIDLAQAESDTNAWVLGNDVLPPTADVKYHNRKPSYPAEAALRGEQGTVVLIVHVGADGLVHGIDVARSSGFPALDHAAIDAVRTWHFLPSVRDGQPVPADMPAKFVFIED